ncbi:MAG: serine hydrolase [Gordonia sp. (in: high G+C Gram-positive bacteria)]
MWPLIRNPFDFFANLRSQGEMVRIYIGNRPIYFFTTARLAIERLTGRDLASHLSRKVFEPLGMKDTAFGIQDQSQLARIEAKTSAGMAPVSFALPENPEFYSGGGGLYGTPRDYLTFARMLAAGGTWNGMRIVRATTECATKRPRPRVDQSAPWLGRVVQTPNFWADADGATTAVLFTQIVPFADPAVISLFANIESAVRAMV